MEFTVWWYMKQGKGIQQRIILIFRIARTKLGNIIKYLASGTRIRDIVEGIEIFTEGNYKFDWRFHNE